MDLVEFLKSSKVLIVAGKGGVGRTTVSATIAMAASQHGMDVVIAELEGKSGLPRCFGHSNESLDFMGIQLAENILGRLITPDDALVEYLIDHGMKRISKKLASSGILDVVATAIPGIRDILVLGKIKQLEREAGHDLIVVDAPATGHTLSFLSSAKGLIDSARSGPVRSQANDVLDLLSDPERCQVMLVTLPEETPVNEAVEAAFSLEDRIGVKLGPIIVNALLPLREQLDCDVKEEASKVSIDLSETQIHALSDAATFYKKRREMQQDQVKRLKDELPLHQIYLPELFTSEIGVNEINILSKAFVEAAKNVEET
ncbi:MAG: ArsA family ATPase [Acidimicrobiales bacterium]|nr:ArsA family ATPase [Acidimicrobiales bacterium]